MACLLGCTIAAGAESKGDAESADLPPELMKELLGTTVSVDLRAGAGYKDNVLLTETNPIKSAFLRADVDAFIWKPPVVLTDAYWAISGSETRYLGAPSDAKSERVWLTQGELRYAIGTYFKAGLMIQGYYQDQVLDLSTSETGPLRARFRVFGVTGGPNLRWEIHDPWWFEVSAAWKLERYEGVAEDYHEPATVLRVGRRLGKRHELSVAWLWKHRGYTDRNAYTIGGRPLAGTHLSTNWNQLELRFVSNWSRSWSSAVKLAGDKLRDSASGYFDYNHWRGELEVKWHKDPWQLRLTASRGLHDYKVQVSGTGFDPPSRQIRLSRVSIGGERKLTEKLSAFLESDVERNNTKDPGGSYRLNTVFTGLSYEF